MLARHFPPIGGAGVHRTVGSVRYLPVWLRAGRRHRRGAEHRDRWEPRDEQLLDRDPGRRAGPPRAAPSRAGRRRALERLRGVPPPWVRAWVRDSARARRRGRPRRRRGLRVLPALRDRVRGRAGRARARAAVGRRPRGPVGARRDARRLEPRCTARSTCAACGARWRPPSAIVMAAPEAAARVRAAMPELAARVGSRGSRSASSRRLRRRAAPRRPTASSGSSTPARMHTDLGEHLRRTRLRRRLLGGTTPGLDVLTRSHVFLVAGARAADRRRPGARAAGRAAPRGRADRRRPRRGRPATPSCAARAARPSRDASR